MISILSITKVKFLGGTRVRDPFWEKIEDIISPRDPIDVKSSNGRFTWTNKRVGFGHIVAQLDHFLIQ